MEILRVEHLSKIYGKGEATVKALDDVSFTVQKGEFVAIIGPSGSGKVHPASYARRGGPSHLGEGLHRRYGYLRPE